MPKIIPTKKNTGCQIFSNPGFPDIAPIIIGLSSSSGASNSTTTVYVNGLNFLEGSKVYFSGQACTTFYNTPRSIFFYVPSYPIRGNYEVNVKTTAGTSNSIIYTVL